jgi:hypothetical protein
MRGVFLLCSGCLCGHAQLGVTSDGVHSGIEGALMAGVAFDVDEHAAVVIDTGGVVMPARGTPLATSVDYVWLPEHARFAARAGAWGVHSEADPLEIIAARGAALVVLRDESEHTKVWLGADARSRSVFALGLQGTLGAATTPGFVRQLDLTFDIYHVIR